MSSALQILESPAAQDKLLPSAAEHIRRWLTEPEYAEYVPQVEAHLQQAQWQTLNDVFWMVIPFGTGGRRGKMYPIGCNVVNDRTIGESAQGLAVYVRSQHGAEASLSCAIAYDTRHNSRRFAELCSEVMVAQGFTVYFLDGYRSTPELSVAVRLKGCACGIMVTASHNPPSDNAIKAYWSTGGQLLPPHDEAVIECVMKVQAIKRKSFNEALAAGKIVYCQAELDRYYIQQVAGLSSGGPRDLKILYSPMHGVGSSAVPPSLALAGFKDVETYAPHAEPNGDFPNVPGHVANPENPATFDGPIERAKASDADIILSTDPDADRLGCAAPLTAGGAWATLSGNQIAALLTAAMLEGRRGAGRLSSQQYLVKTLVTSELVRRIGDSYGVKTFGNLLVGFKWIAGCIDEQGPENFLLGMEESHGYMAGTYARDKDAAGAALLLAELAARAKAEGKTLHEKLDALYWQFGCHVEKQVSLTMPGASGMMTMQKLMERLRTNPPEKLGKHRVLRVKDYGRLVTIEGGREKPLVGPKGDMVIFEMFDEGNYVAVRPSGTEPKVKFYLFGYEAPEQIAHLEDTKRDVAKRLAEYAEAFPPIVREVS